MMSTLRVVHRWIGLVLTLPLLLQAGSGIILAIEPVITDVSLPSALHEPGATPQPLSALVAAARAAAPALAVPSLYLAS